MKKENIALIIILAIQLLVYIFLGVQKSYIHMDEAYSIGLTNYDKVEITGEVDGWYQIKLNGKNISNFIYRRYCNDCRKTHSC